MRRTTRSVARFGRLAPRPRPMDRLRMTDRGDGAPTPRHGRLRHRALHLVFRLPPCAPTPPPVQVVRGGPIELSVHFAVRLYWAERLRTVVQKAGVSPPPTTAPRVLTHHDRAPATAARHLTAPPARVAAQPPRTGAPRRDPAWRAHAAVDAASGDFRPSVRLIHAYGVTRVTAPRAPANRPGSSLHRVISGRTRPTLPGTLPDRRISTVPSEVPDRRSSTVPREVPDRVVSTIASIARDRTRSLVSLELPDDGGPTGTWAAPERAAPSRTLSANRWSLTFVCAGPGELVTGRRPAGPTAGRTTAAGPDRAVVPPPRAWPEAPTPHAAGHAAGRLLRSRGTFAPEPVMPGFRDASRRHPWGSRKAGSGVRSLIREPGSPVAGSPRQGTHFGTYPARTRAGVLAVGDRHRASCLLRGPDLLAMVGPPPDRFGADRRWFMTGRIRTRTTRSRGSTGSPRSLLHPNPWCRRRWPSHGTEPEPGRP